MGSVSGSISWLFPLRAADTADKRQATQRKRIAVEQSLAVLPARANLPFELIVDPDVSKADHSGRWPCQRQLWPMTCPRVTVWNDRSALIPALGTPTARPAATGRHAPDAQAARTKLIFLRVGQSYLAISEPDTGRACEPLGGGLVTVRVVNGEPTPFAHRLPVASARMSPFFRSVGRTCAQAQAFIPPSTVRFAPVM